MRRTSRRCFSARAQFPTESPELFSTVRHALTIAPKSARHTGQIPELASKLGSNRYRSVDTGTIGGGMAISKLPDRIARPRIRSYAAILKSLPASPLASCLFSCAAAENFYSIGAPRIIPERPRRPNNFWIKQVRIPGKMPATKGNSLCCDFSTDRAAGPCAESAR